MQRTGKYTKDDPMSDLVSDNYRILLLMSRFGIGLGFGESSIGEVCRANGVDTSTFLIVTNMMLYDEIPADAYDKVSMEGLLSYLHNSHDYFLGFRLPAIREKLAAAVGTGSDLSRAIMKYFDDYTAGVHTHMAYEEEVVFPLRTRPAGGAPPAGLQHRHLQPAPRPGGDAAHGVQEHTD